MPSARFVLPFLAAALACGPRDAQPDAFNGDAAAAGPDSFMIPPVVTRAVVVVFILPAVDDSMVPEEAAAAMEEFRQNTAEAAPFFQAHGVEMVFTNADSIFVQLPNRRRDVVLLAGLEAPFGYVLLEPGLSERILAGLYTAEELEEEARTYFTVFGTDTIPRKS